MTSETLKRTSWNFEEYMDVTDVYFAWSLYAEKEAPIPLPLPVAVEDVRVRCTGAVEGRDEVA